MRRLLIWLIVTAVLPASFVQTVRSTFKTDSALAVAESRSLPRSTPERQGISSAAVLDFVDTADRQIDMMNSFIMVRHGYVVAEGWWSPYDAKTPHVLYSLSKSFTSTAVGLAISEGKLSLDDEVLKFFAEDAPSEPSANLKAMRVRDLLRMATGNVAEASFSGDRPWTKAFLAQPVPFKPGTHFLYNSPATYMLSAIVQKATGMTVLEYLKPRLFEPLGFDNPTWVMSPQGITAGAFGLALRTEEIASFGQLYLQKGNWRGKQLVPASWIEEATARQTANGSSPNSDWDQGYGYQFWRSRHNTFRGDGAFGQYCMVMPEYDAVVAITSGVRDMQAVMNLVWTKLLPAMNPDRLREDAEGQRRLTARLAALTVKPVPGRMNSTLAETISGRWFEFPQNDLGIKAISFDFKANFPVFVVRTPGGELRNPLGSGSWSKADNGFAAGMEKFLSVPARPLLATSGGWSANDVFQTKILLYQTPYYATLTFRFEGDHVLLDTEYNVSFGPRNLPQLIGQAAR